MRSRWTSSPEVFGLLSVLLFGFCFSVPEDTQCFVFRFFISIISLLEFFRLDTPPIVAMQFLFLNAFNSYFVILVPIVNMLAEASKPLLCNSDTRYQCSLKPPNLSFTKLHN